MGAMWGAGTNLGSAGRVNTDAVYSSEGSSVAPSRLHHRRVLHDDEHKLVLCGAVQRLACAHRLWRSIAENACPQASRKCDRCSAAVLCTAALPMPSTHPAHMWLTWRDHDLVLGAAYAQELKVVEGVQLAHHGARQRGEPRDHVRVVGGQRLLQGHAAGSARKGSCT